MLMRLKAWLDGLLGIGSTMTEREAQNAVRVGRGLTMIGEVYPSGARQSDHAE